MKKLAKKRKVVIDDNDDNAVAEAESGQRHKADDSLEIASIDDDSDNDEVCENCEVMYVAARIFLILLLCLKSAMLPGPLLNTRVEKMTYDHGRRQDFCCGGGGIGEPNRACP